MSALTTHKIWNQREKEKEKKQIKINLNKQSKAKKGKEQYHLKRTSLGPLRQGQRLDTSEANHAQAKRANHQTNSRTTQRAPAAQMQAPPEPKHTPPEPMQQCNTGMQQRAKICSLCPGWLDCLHQAVRLPTTHLTAWEAVRPHHVTDPTPNCSKFAQTNLNTFQMLPGAQNMHKLLPLIDNA
jgi:hypothetical protein